MKLTAASPVAATMQWVAPSRLWAAFFVRSEMTMKLCKCCRALMISHEASNWLHHLEKLLKFHGFVPKTIPDIAMSLGPMCEKCQMAWTKHIASKN
jgi:hypothetical protein